MPGGDCGELAASFPAVTLPRAGQHDDRLPPAEHGVVANGFYLREEHRVEMWTSPNSCIERPQLWDILHEQDSRLDLGSVVSAA